MPQGSAADSRRRSTGALSTLAIARMDADLPWFAELSAQDRSWVGMVVPAGIRSFVEWYDEKPTSSGGQALASSIYGAAPRALAGVITLPQTVDLVRLAIDVI